MIITNMKSEYVKKFYDLNHQIMFKGQPRGAQTSIHKIFTLHGYTKEEVENHFVLPNGTKKDFIQMFLPTRPPMELLGFREIPGTLSINSKNKSIHINKNSSNYVYIILNEYIHKDGECYSLNALYKDKKKQDIITTTFESSTIGGGHRENLFIAKLVENLVVEWATTYHHKDKLLYIIDKTGKIIPG